MPLTEAATPPWGSLLGQRPPSASPQRKALLGSRVEGALCWQDGWSGRFPEADGIMERSVLAGPAGKDGAQAFRRQCLLYQHEARAMAFQHGTHGKPQVTLPSPSSNTWGSLPMNNCQTSGIFYPTGNSV